ncbi:MAG TPA: DEAD/DEAH box helicase, partial [Candidatus Paceibacterota bacterium]
MYSRTQRAPSGRTFKRPTFGRSNGGRRTGGRSKTNVIHHSKFINKAVVTETVEHFVPVNQFIDFPIDEKLKENIITKGYTTPTPIQDKAIPHVLKGEDIVGIANTGTGKTAAFLVPLINKVLTNPKENVLIVVPTRELALQIQDELKGFIPGMKLFSTVCVGGSSIGNQIRDLRYRNEFVIGTPGRIKDLIERKVLNLSFFKTVVLDEADRMLDMGFINDMKFMMALMPKDRHTL